MDTVGGFLANSCRSGRRGFSASVLILAIIIGCILLAYIAFASPPNDVRNNLQQVSIVFRHGDKNPVETYPNDPYVNYAWPGGWGTLTKKGMLQIYTLGQTLRRRYGSFISNNYLSTETLIRSSSSDRCIMSAQALLAALFEPAVEDQFKPGLSWRPVPVFAIPKNVDKFIMAKAACPRLDRELAQAYVNSSINANDPLIALCRELTTYTGKNVSSILHIEEVYNVLEIEAFNNLKLPEWANKYYNDQTKELAAASLSIFTSNFIQRRLRGGPFLKDVLDHMKMRRNGTDDHKVYLYAGHDLTLVNVLRAMGFTEEILRPEYGATLMFELYTTNGGQDHEVKILYLNNTETTEPHTINMPGCGEPCLLDTLYKILEPVLPENWEKECLT